MWVSNVTQIDPYTLQYEISTAGLYISYQDVLNYWTYDGKFRSWFRRLLADVPFSEFFWETVAVTKATANNRFEFTITNSNSLDSLNLDKKAFQDHFAMVQEDCTIVEFPNLGGDALLIAPVPYGKESAYKHLAKFVRDGPAQQAESIWQVLGKSISSRLGVKPLWVSTSGLGVGWLHIRIDTYPKYYQYAPYTNSDHTQPM